MQLPDMNVAPAAEGRCSGTRASFMDTFPNSIGEKVKNHPCYFSYDAHPGSMPKHVAVATACNSQCLDGNSNHTGVVFKLLSPNQDVRNTIVVTATSPQMTVLDIAGTENLLAPPKCGLDTLSPLSAKASDIKLRMPTNGLTLPDDAVEVFANRNFDINLR